MLTLRCFQTTGAKLFSSHAGAPTDRLLLDTEPDLYSIQKAQKAALLPVNEVTYSSTYYSYVPGLTASIRVSRPITPSSSWQRLLVFDLTSSPLASFVSHLALFEMPNYDL